MWFVGRPSAGGKLPLWQAAQAAVTTCCVWFHLVGVHSDGSTLWQVKQLRVVGMCVADLPRAVAPWQLEQFVAAVNVLWSVRAPAQVVVVLWQLSQLPVTAACVALLGLPTAARKAPVWQLTQPVVML